MLDTDNPRILRLEHRAVPPAVRWLVLGYNEHKPASRRLAVQLYAKTKQKRFLTRMALSVDLLGLAEIWRAVICAQRERRHVGRV